ncbi:endonuclease/exonuclease/phosphatase family protein, partial [Trifolium medium]|nr:endonuclease/exonuclease/phosphatase family protein [Trifolium medium]
MREKIAQRRLPGYVRAAQEECVTFFFTNFPHTENLLGLRKVFGSFGRVGDIFIPAKKNKFGQRFGFVRFKVVSDVDVLLDKLQDIWLGKFKLRVNVSRFGRDSRVAVVAQETTSELVRARCAAAVPDKSFLEALSNKVGTSKVVSQTISLPLPPPRSVYLEVSSSRLHFLKNCLVGFLKEDVDPIVFMDRLVLEGFHDLNVCPMGGALVLLSSKVEGVLSAFLELNIVWKEELLAKVEPWTPVTYASRRELIKIEESTLLESNYVKGRIKVWIPVVVSRVDEVVV